MKMQDALKRPFRNNIPEPLIANGKPLSPFVKLEEDAASSVPSSMSTGVAATVQEAEEEATDAIEAVAE